ncbi:hypothetical protein A2960_00755 [Candidatus Gottesmanbacteria bacterium RIFCSPLOWO2_01_FULL_39_12b]|uniref:Transport permease protein n=1 Tax=Candidatus Gottesmanbacteria bacterium RIFCSPLOWO2_01_FULL_39_12b TaxID=1798388 RepID=A0A1F6APU8_9BACT|nr:MAG: hypothetical protein A2960_00755 [Candidatus Gottesmanbacteria bacterium RIFCSPLOWO2_01_FULL_39_12b]
MFKDIVVFLRYKDLLINLTEREIKARYKQSILGYFWVILNPFLQMLVMTFIFSIVMKVPSLGVPYPIFLYVALLPWNFFSNSLSSSMNSLVANSSLITKIYFPREILVYSTVFAKVIDLILAVSILVIFMIIYRIPVSTRILWVPVIFIIQLIFTTGLSLILSTFNLFYRDIQYLVSLMLMLWMYLTPVIYPVEIIPNEYRFILSLNPMAVFVNAYRQVILGGGDPNLNSLIIGVIVSLFVFLAGFSIFKKLEGIFSDVV